MYSSCLSIPIGARPIVWVRPLVISFLRCVYHIGHSRRSLEFQSDSGQWKNCFCEVVGTSFHVLSEKYAAPPIKQIDLMRSKINSGAGVQDILPCSARCFQLRDGIGTSIWFRVDTASQASSWVEQLNLLKSGNNRAVKVFLIFCVHYFDDILSLGNIQQCT